MHSLTLCLLVISSVTLFVVLTQAQSDFNYNTAAAPESRLYPYSIKGFVQDVRHQPLRFIGGLFFKKAFILLKLKLKWKLKKKIILKKLLKKLFHFHGRKRRAATFSFPRDEEHDTRESRQPEEFPVLTPRQQRQYEQEYSQYFPHDQEPKDSDIMKYLSMASEFDTNGCIPKGICEIMANGTRSTNQFENNILEYYNDNSDEKQDTTGTPAHIYDYAASLGRSSFGRSNRNGRACDSHFPSCPDPPKQLNTFMNELFSSEMCDAPVSNYI